MQNAIELAHANDTIQSEQEKSKFLSEELDMLKPLIYESLEKLKTASTDLDTRLVAFEKFVILFSLARQAS